MTTSTESTTAGATSASAPILVADNLVAGYLPGVNILNGCTLTVGDGELVGIIGPNGAGKSTLLKALFGLVNVRSGTVTLEGDDITNKRANTLVARGVGFVPRNRLLRVLFSTAACLVCLALSITMIAQHWIAP